MIPAPRLPQATSVQRRVSASQRLSNWPVMSAATANPNGTVNPTYPRYSITG